MSATKKIAKLSEVIKDSKSTKSVPVKLIKKETAKSGSANNDNFQAHNSGRRKEAVARVWLSIGKSGDSTVNGRDLSQYFCNKIRTKNVLQPFALLQIEHFLVYARINGGGLSAQSDALRLAISKALLDLDPTYRTALKTAGFLTRDARVVARKLYGRKKARKRFQFVKR